MIEYFWTGDGRTEHQVNLMPKSLDGKVIPVTSFCGIEIPSGVKSGTQFDMTGFEDKACKECRTEKQRLIIDSFSLKTDKRDVFTSRITGLLSIVPGDLRKEYQILRDNENGNREYEGQSRTYEFRSSAIWLFGGTTKLIEYRHYREWEDDVISDQLADSLDNIYLFNNDPIAQRVFECLREEAA